LSRRRHQTKRHLEGPTSTSLTAAASIDVWQVLANSEIDANPAGRSQRNVQTQSLGMSISAAA
jgi:hypothetical protein